MQKDIQFLFCSTVFKRKQYTVMHFKPESNLVEELNYFLTHRTDGFFWPLYVKADIMKCHSIDPVVPLLLRGLMVGSAKCKLQYNGKIFDIDEIVLSNDIPSYWKIRTNSGTYLIDPTSAEFI